MGLQPVGELPVYLEKLTVVYVKLHVLVHGIHLVWLSLLLVQVKMVIIIVQKLIRKYIELVKKVKQMYVKPMQMLPLKKLILNSLILLRNSVTVDSKLLKKKLNSWAPLKKKNPLKFGKAFSICTILQFIIKLLLPKLYSIKESEGRSRKFSSVNLSWQRIC